MCVFLGRAFCLRMLFRWCLRIQKQSTFTGVLSLGSSASFNPPTPNPNPTPQPQPQPHSLRRRSTSATSRGHAPGCCSVSTLDPGRCGCDAAQGGAGGLASAQLLLLSFCSASAQLLLSFCSASAQLLLSFCSASADPRTTAAALTSAHHPHKTNPSMPPPIAIPTHPNLHPMRTQCASNAGAAPQPPR